MQVSEAIVRMENHLSTGTWSETMQQAWQTLKAAVSEQTAHNTASAPCVHDRGSFPADVCSTCGEVISLH
jgi:hypothetical protein